MSTDMSRRMMRLSICIPTHHGRCGTLREALDSVLPQITPELHGRVEVCINDNASDDGTEALVAQFNGQYPGVIRYHRNPENQGFTRNLMRVIAGADGDYCWMFSSDDVMAPNGIARVLEILDEYPDLTGMTVSTLAFNADMTKLMPNGLSLSLLPPDSAHRHLYTSPDEIFRACGSVMGYTSVQVLDRRLWAEVLTEIGEAGFTQFFYFPYLYVFGKMVKKKPQWLWLPESLVHSRADNDYLSSHLDKNMLRYHRLTMDEAARVWGELFGFQSATYFSLMRDNYVNFWNAPSLLRYKALNRCTVSEEMQALLWYPRRLWFLPAFWLFSFPALLLPHPLARLGAAVVRLLGLGQTLRQLRKRLFPL